MSARNGNDTIRLGLSSRLELLGIVDKLADGVAEILDWQDEDRDGFAIAVVEAVTNAIQHGNQDDPDRMVELTIEIGEEVVTVTVADTGEGFSPPEAQEDMAPDLLASRGRGIFIMRNLMDEVHFDFGQGTRVRLVKRRSSAAAEGKGEGAKT